MVLSFHPIFTADKNIICAGRNPDNSDLAAIKKAEAVILPQGCSEPLYTMAKTNCPNIFPNFDARFQYLGKINQIELFQKTNTPYPKTETFKSVSVFNKRYGHPHDTAMFTFPIVFKFDWGGEGNMVYQALSLEELNRLLEKAKEFEKTGQSGFLIQETIQSKGRSLRVNVIGQQFYSYWRILDNSCGFHANLSKGAKIDHDSFPELQKVAKSAVSDFCRKAEVNLAGFDILFSFNSSGLSDANPLFLEINYFFGRQGLGGSEKFYDILNQEINIWLKDLGLSTEV